MILVDTSVLIDYLKGSDSLSVSAMDEILNKKIPFGINVNIYQEVLQGAKTEKEFFLLKEYLETIPFYELKLGLESYEKAAFMNYKCRKAGVTIRSTIDLIIARTAIENDIFLFHNDKDFDHINQVFPELKVYQVN